MSDLLDYLHAVTARRDLSAAEAERAMRALLAPETTPAQIAAFLIALHMKGETAQELAGFARALRAAAVRIPYEVPADETLLDTCGTGGDGLNTFNISTTVAFVVAGCGVRVAKHGNRALSSASGSADVMEELGIGIAGSPEQAARALETAGICFLFAPAFHPATGQVQAVRRELKIRTAFNLLGPLSNPAPTRAQIVGTPSLAAASQLAAALAELGLERGFVVHGGDGLDEVTITTYTDVFEIRHGFVSQSVLDPGHFGLQQAGLETLRGGSPAENARSVCQILHGEKGPRRDIVLMNAALALVAAGAAANLLNGMELATQAVDSGAAYERLERFRGIR